MKNIGVIAIILLGAFNVQAQNTVSERDKKFAVEAAEGGLMEVKLGELAQVNGLSEAVKNLGSQMAADHSKANNELRSLASTKNITLPTTLSEKGMRAYDKLSKKQGKDFDKAYTKCMVKDHKKDICEFKKEAKKGSDSDLKSWASNTVSTLEHHKEMSIEACKAVKAKK